MFVKLVSDRAYLRIPWKPPILLWLRWASTLTAMRVCICVAVSANDLHTECLWHRDTLPSQIGLKHCHNKPLNQVCAPSKSLCFYCSRRHSLELSTTGLRIILSASCTWHPSHSASAVSLTLPIRPGSRFKSLRVLLKLLRVL